MPLHFVQLSSPIASGTFRIAVRPKLPNPGIQLILRNDLAGGKMYPSPEVVLNPTVESTVEPNSSTLFPVCAVTRAQARKLRDVVDLSDSFMSASDPADSSSQNETIELGKDMASVC